jgi:hypothetical protein
MYVSFVSAWGFCQLRNIIIMSTGGIILFSKDFVKHISNPSMLASLLTAMVTFSRAKTGLPTSYIEFSSVALSVTINAEARVMCALVTDLVDGAYFSELLSSEILGAFVSTYEKRLSDSDQVNNTDAFSDFNVQISEVIRNTVGPALEHLQTQKSIVTALLIQGDVVAYSTNDVDQVGILANHDALVRSSTDVLGPRNDETESITLTGMKTTITIRRFMASSLVVMFKNSITDTGLADIEKAAAVIHKLLSNAANLQS